MSMGLKANADGSGAIQVGGSDAITITSGLNTTFAGTASVATGALYPLVSGTAVASTSGTSIDFTGIPSTAKRITVMLRSVSTTGTSNYLIRIGNTTFTATGYTSVMNYVNIGANSCTGDTDTTGFRLTKDTTAAWSFSAVATIVQQTSGFYICTFTGMNAGGPGYFGTGILNLGSDLDRVRITTVNGTDTFDAGTINIMWE